MAATLISNCNRGFHNSTRRFAKFSGPMDSFVQKEEKKKEKNEKNFVERNLDCIMILCPRHAELRKPDPVHISSSDVSKSVSRLTRGEVVGNYRIIRPPRCLYHFAYY